jgi:CheY-like chemotaxis protein
VSPSVFSQRKIRDNRPTVLVVEDEVLIRIMVADELRDHGFNVVETSNADEALSVLQSQVPVDLLFTDLNMPGQVDALFLATFVRASYPTMKLVIASGQPVGEYLRDVAHATFSKPYDAAVVASRVKALLADLERETTGPMGSAGNGNRSCG